EFQRRVADRGVLPPEYLALDEKIGDLGPKDTTQEFAQSRIAFARGFVEACRTATEQVGKNLKLKTETPEATESPKPGEKSKQDDQRAASTGASVFDLRGVACPLNYVKTKLKLEMMYAGEPIKNVPMSLRNDGHKILTEEPLEPEAKHFKILVEKVEG
ncbi:MAG: hypothetical protein C4294_07395, partial [Nitrospiraceae bacterium]